jgi:hypothetical protein
MILPAIALGVFSPQFATRGVGKEEARGRDPVSLGDARFQFETSPRQGFASLLRAQCMAFRNKRRRDSYQTTLAIIKMLSPT